MYVTCIVIEFTEFIIRGLTLELIDSGRRRTPDEGGPSTSHEPCERSRFFELSMKCFYLTCGLQKNPT